MANRRKFLAGLGALASGSAAAVGTGALTTTRAERGFKVDTAGDADAYVGLDGNVSSQFVSQSGGTLSLDFATDTSNGEGVNMGVTEVRPAFSLTNQSKETLYIQIENPLSNNDITTNASANDASEVSYDIPAGIDFQFIAVPTGKANGIKVDELALIGRKNAPSSGPDFQSATGQGTISNIPGSASKRYLDEDQVGHLELSSGDSVDVIARVLATQEVNPPEIDFTIEAFSEQEYAQGTKVDI
jgi:hypothetical protein